jgi:MFS family permease
MTSPGSSPSSPRLWRNRDYLTLWTGQTISAVGSSMSTFVFPIAGYALTGSTTQAALAGTSYLVGSVATRLPAGALVDRWNRRVVMAVSAGGGALLYGALVADILLGRLTLLHLLVVALLTGVAAAFLEPAESAAVREVVPTEQLPAALSQNEARQHAARLVGPPVGGLLYAAARWMPFLADAVSYLVAAAAVLTVRSPLAAPERGPQRTRILGEVTEGLRFLMSRSFFRAVAASATLINFAITALFLVLTLKLLRAGVHPAAIGVIETVGAVAGIAGAVVAPFLVRRVPSGRIVALGCLLLPAGLAPMALTNNVAVISGLLAVAMVGVPAINSATFSYLLAVTPDRMQGRVSSGLMFSATAVQPAGPLVGGFLLGWLGGSYAMLITAALMGLGVLALATNPDVRRLPTPDRWDTASEPSAAAPAA